MCFFYMNTVLQDAQTNANIKVLAALIQDCYFALVRLIDPPIKTLLVAMSLVRCVKRVRCMGVNIA